MKKLLLPALLVTAIALPFGRTAAVHAQNDKLDFTLINKTGLVIHELYVSPGKSDEWGDDILGRDVLKNGEKVDITFSPKAKACSWDMKIVDEEKDSVEWTNLNLCEANEITLMYEKGKPTAIIK